MPIASFCPAIATLRNALSSCFLAFALAACGGSGDDSSSDGDSRIRVLNVTNDIASVDLYTELADDDDDLSLRIAGVPIDGTADYEALAADSYDIEIRRGGSDATLLRQTGRSLSDDARYTVVVYGYSGNYGAALLEESQDDDDLDSGKAGLRVFHASSDAGNLDVYLTTTEALLSESSPNVSNLSGVSLGGFGQITGGTYRLRVTAAGDASDVRLDVPVLTLETGRFATLVLTAGDGGVLVHGYLIQEAGALTAAKNGSARVRVVASVPDSGSVTLLADGATLASASRSPTVGSYRLIDAGDVTINASVNDASVSAPAFTAKAGSDYTLLVAGEGAGLQVAAIADDNRLPEATGKAKIRLVNALAGDTAGLTLSVDFDAVATGVSFATASAPAEVDGGSDVQLQVTSPLEASPLYSADELTIEGQGVYTVFLLSGQAQPAGTLRKER